MENAEKVKRNKYDRTVLHLLNQIILASETKTRYQVALETIGYNVSLPSESHNLYHVTLAQKIYDQDKIIKYAKLKIMKMNK
jgi:hypothetical protein